MTAFLGCLVITIGLVWITIKRDCLLVTACCSTGSISRTRGRTKGCSYHPGSRRSGYNDPERPSVFSERRLGWRRRRLLCSHIRRRRRLGRQVRMSTQIGKAATLKKAARGQKVTSSPFFCPMHNSKFPEKFRTRTFDSS